MVNKPRREDVRAVVLLCSMCHDLQHGEDLPRAQLCAPTLSTMLWTKRLFDRANYSRKWLESNQVQRLPRIAAPPASVQKVFRRFRGLYPGEATRPDQRRAMIEKAALACDDLVLVVQYRDQYHYVTQRILSPVRFENSGVFLALDLEDSARPKNFYLGRVLSIRFALASDVLTR